MNSGPQRAVLPDVMSLVARESRPVTGTADTITKPTVIAVR